MDVHDKKRGVDMNKLVLVMKEEGQEKPVELWRSTTSDEQANNKIFETIAAQFDSEKVETKEENEPLLTLRLEPIESTDISSYVRDFSIDAEKKDELINYLDEKSTN